MAQRASKLRGLLTIVQTGIQRQNITSVAASPYLSKNVSSCVARCKDVCPSSLLNYAAGQEKLPGISGLASSSGLNQSVIGIAKTIHQFKSIVGFPQRRGEEARILGNTVGRYRSAHCPRLRQSGSNSRFWPGNGSSNIVFKQEAISSTRSGGGNVQGWKAYHVDSRGMQHFKRRGPTAWTEKFVSQGSAGFFLVLAGGGLVVYYTNLQTVPYTHRRHFVLISPKLERSVGDRSYEAIMQQYKNKLLSPTHPQSARVSGIADQVIEALMLGVGASDWGKLEHGAPEIATFSKDRDRGLNGEEKSDRPLFETDAGLLEHTHDHHHGHDDSTMDEGWVDRSRQEGLQAGREGYTKHLEGMKWKVVVVDDEIVNAVCIPGGKIVVFSGLLKKFRSDAEVATVIAHEVGHAVARHSAEALTDNLFIVALQLLVLSVFYVPGLVNSVSELLLRLPFSRRMEIEADHIGLILMAAAGYDPRLAPGFYEKLGKLDKTPEYAQYMSTHPSGKKRGEMLRKTATMEEALSIYQRKASGQGTEGFF